MYYQDLYPLICILPRYVNAADSTGRDDDLLPLWVASEDGEHPYDHSTDPTRRSESIDPEEKLRSAQSTPKPSLFGSFGRRPIQRAKTFDPEKALAEVQSHRPLKPARNPPRTTIYDYVPVFLVFKPFTRLFNKTKNAVVGESGTTRNLLGRKRKPQLGDSNVPLEITLFLSKYVRVPRSAQVFDRSL